MSKRATKKKTPAKKTKKCRYPKRRVAQAAKIFDADITIPAAGPSDFGAGPDWTTPNGTLPDNPASATAALYDANGLIQSVDATIAGDRWTATFPGVLPFVPGAPMRFLLEAVSTNMETTSIGVEFSQSVPPAPMITMTAAPAGDFNFNVTVTSVANTTGLTAAVDGGAPFAITAGTPFTTNPCESDTQDITITATNDSGGSAEFDFECNVDWTAPTFTSFENDSTNLVVIYNGTTVADAGSAFVGLSSLNVSVNGAIYGPVPARNISVVVTSMPNPQTINFTISIRYAKLQGPDTYTITVTATDVFGNVSDPPASDEFPVGE